jgi:hypothetical protein
MSLRQRSFRGDADWAAMAAVVEAQPADHLHLVDLPYRLCSWAFDDPANAALWEDAAGAVRAWAALQTPFWSIDYALDPAAPPGVLQALLAWVAQRARAVRGTPFARPAWFISSPAGHPHNAELEAAGFRSQADVGPNSWTKLLFRRDCQSSPYTAQQTAAILHNRRQSRTAVRTARSSALLHTPPASHLSIRYPPRSSSAAVRRTYGWEEDPRERPS